MVRAAVPLNIAEECDAESHGDENGSAGTLNGGADASSPEGISSNAGQSRDCEGNDSAGENEIESQDCHLQTNISARGIHELGKKCQKEQGDFGIENICQNALPENCGAAIGW